MISRFPSGLWITGVFLQMTLFAQMTTSPEALASLYDKTHVAAISSRRFTQRQMTEWLAPAVADGTITAEVVGTSGEGRPLTLYVYGSGPVKVYLWSQMHGDEPTATMALVDIVEFFRSEKHHPVASLLREQLTLLILPMINPDGAERFTRRTAQGIDMNRDAQRLATPEARVLKAVRDRFQPEFGFNLHDQDPRYTVGTTGQMTAIALLAPPTDDARSDNQIRHRAKQVVAGIVTALQGLVAGRIAKWDDTFEPRAFGDNVQKWGTSTVLIESGGWKGDRDKMMLRKANFVALLSAMQSIGSTSYAHADISSYERLPFNMKLGCDVLLRNARLRLSAQAPAAVVDVAFNLDEVAGAATLRATITDIGDLSTFVAFETIDAGGVELDPALVTVDKVLTIEEFKSLIPRK